VTINSYTHSRTTSGHRIGTGGTVSGHTVSGPATSGHVISGAAVPLPVAARRRRRATCDGVASWSSTAAGGGQQTTSIIVRRHDAETKSFHEAAATLGEVDRDGRKQAAMASVVAHTVIHSFRGSSSSSTPDRLPDRTRKRPPGRPRSKRLDQIRSGNSLRSPADPWRRSGPVHSAARSVCGWWPAASCAVGERSIQRRTGDVRTDDLLRRLRCCCCCCG